MPRFAALIPGYASVARASAVLHLAPRSVRDLIYAGRIPSLRIGRLHFIRASDLEAERRRRVGLPAPHHQPSKNAHPHRAKANAPRDPTLDDVLRRQRAVERAEMVTRWAQRHGVLEAHVPAHVREVGANPLTCESCGRTVRQGRYIEMSGDETQAAASLCTTCGRRALLEWADRRRLEAAAARQMSQSLGDPERPIPEQLAYNLEMADAAATEALAGLALPLTSEETPAA
jgi:hypothetical protein